VEVEGADSVADGAEAPGAEALGALGGSLEVSLGAGVGSAGALGLAVPAACEWAPALLPVAGCFGFGCGFADTFAVFPLCVPCLGA
jgi:hypothetical protein